MADTEPRIRVAPGRAEGMGKGVCGRAGGRATVSRDVPLPLAKPVRGPERRRERIVVTKGVTLGRVR